MISLGRPPRICVLGMMTKIPVGGVVWQTLHYLEGFRRLGCEVSYVEAHARTPSMFMETETDDGSGRAAEFLQTQLSRVGLGNDWALWALHDDGRVLGVGEHGLERMLRGADAVINLHGGTDPALVELAAGRLIYVETDPVQLQIELHDGNVETEAFLDAHESFFTFGELWGRSTSGLPASPRYHFQPTRQPVILDWWNGPELDASAPVTTVANWRQPWREVWFNGERYGWSKDEEFAAVLDLPRRCGDGVGFELALSGIDTEAMSALNHHGWRTVDGLQVSTDPDRYRDYLWASQAEFTVAKDQNVRLRSGWFSDRSATYLASGRPVITQSTGFEEVLPTGLGLQSFTDLDSAIEAVDRVVRNPAAAGAQARDIAREYFDHDAVLSPLLESIGLLPRQPRDSSSDISGVMPWNELAVRPVSRRPLRLDASEHRRILDHPMPAMLPAIAPLAPVVSLVVVTWNHLALTRLCLESVLHDPTMRDAEIVVVDNGSDDGTVEYLSALEARSSRVRPVILDHNTGFAHATNVGVTHSTAPRLVLLNNDTIVSPGAIARLVRHLDDASIGVVGALAPHAGNEARVAWSASTWTEHVEASDRWAIEHAGRRLDVAMVTLFCAALRRETWTQVGPLDEDFAVGMFEDDDYAERLRRAGLRSTLALDVVVHHWGEGSFGDLFASGAHSDVFAVNRSRFETKWDREWSTHGRHDEPDYLELTGRVVAMIERATPAGAAVAVISQGDERLCAAELRTARHFPSSPDGRFAGHHPADGAEAARFLDAATADGAQYLLIPEPSRWWLEFYEEFARHLTTDWRCVADEPRTGILFSQAGVS